MKRLLLLFPVCLAFAPGYATVATSLPEPSLVPTVALGKQGKPTPERFAELVKTDIVTALSAGLTRYREETKSYTCLMKKQERIKGRLQKPEEIRCAFRESPFSVLMEWQSGEVKASASLFVAGENNDEILVRPAGRLEMMGLKAVGKYFVSRSPSNADVREASRYTVHEFGLARGMERTYAAWKSAKDAGRLNVEYLGERAVPEVDGRKCFVIHRFVDPPEENGMTDLTLFIDSESWMQTGSILKARDELIGSYYFADIAWNPKLAPERFMPEVLKK